MKNYFCVACGGWFRTSCPHGPSVNPTYCPKCGWWTSGCGH